MFSAIHLNSSLINHLLFLLSGTVAHTRVLLRQKFINLVLICKIEESPEMLCPTHPFIAMCTLKPFMLDELLRSHNTVTDEKFCNKVPKCNIMRRALLSKYSLIQ